MKKLLVFGLGAFILLGFSSCKSTESAYKKAYEQAKQQELAQEQEVEYVAPVERQTVEPVVAAPVKKTTPVRVQSNDNSVRQEKVTVVSGVDGLKKYSVVAGSFGVKSNADGLKQQLDGEGYNAVVAYAAEKNMYRVIVSSFDDRGSAEYARDSFKARYPGRKDFQGAWLLYRVF